MGAPIEGWENRRGNFNQRNGIGKGRQGRAFNSVPAPVKFGGLMLRPPRPPFPLNREGMRHPIPPPFGIRTPIRGCRPTMRGRMISQIAPPRLMGPRGPPPLGIRPPQQGFRPPLLGMRLPPQYMMGRPPMPPPPVREFRPGPLSMQGKGRFPNNFRGINQKQKAIKKRRPNMRDIDLSKPWISDAIKAEFAKKGELLAAAKITQGDDDWAKFRQQREKCYQVYHAAEMEHIGQQEDDSKKVSEAETNKNLENQNSVNINTSSQPPSQTESSNNQVATTV